MGAPNNYIKQFNCGISVEPENVDALCDGIKRMVYLPKEEREIMGRNGHNAVIKNFTYEKLGKKFADLF